MADSKPPLTCEEKLLKLRVELVAVGEIPELYEKNKLGATGADEQIIKILWSFGYARHQQIAPMGVGFHKHNRGGILGNSMEIHRIMDQIFKMYFAWN